MDSIATYWPGVPIVACVYEDLITGWDFSKRRAKNVHVSLIIKQSVCHPV